MPEKKLNQFRQPIVAVMGHVDHGKTSFLDAIRGTRVTEKEAGGITQNTRTHEVTTPSDRRITFIDTPGHEAFSNMRSRGAKVTDFVLLIVAADDGVQPQTKESIKFAQEQKVPIIVAINKVDLEGINTQKIKTELSSFGVVVEEYGGDSLCFEISAKEKRGLKEVLEGIELLAEIKELKSNQPKEDTLGEAFVVESNIDKNLGRVALCILKAGNLEDRLFMASKNQFTKVRAYLNEFQKTIPTVHESEPFWITGLKEELEAGDVVYFTQDEKSAKEIHDSLQVNNSNNLEEINNENLDAESLFAQLLMQKEKEKQGEEQKVMNVIIKASTKGTLEAILYQLDELNTDESKINIMHTGTGEVTEDDINRMKMARGLVISFQQPISTKIEQIAKREKVIVRNYEVIYELVDELADVLDSLEGPIEEEVEVARAKVKQVFTLSNGEIIAGSEITKGNMLKGYRLKVERNGEEVLRGKLTNIKQNKNDVKEVKKGMDCGLLISPNPTGIQEGDEIIAFKVETY